MSEIWIDRLILQVPGLLATDGRRLALEVAERLSAAGAVGSARDIPALRLDLTVAASTGIDEWARQVVAEVVRQVQRLP